MTDNETPITILNEAHRAWVGIDRGTRTASDLDRVLDPRRWATHTPTDDDEREALARIVQDVFLLNYDAARRCADEMISTPTWPFRRSEVPEPSAEVRAAAVSVGSGEPCQQIAEEPEWEYGTALRAPSGALWDFEYEGTLEAAQGHVRACEKDGHDHGMDHCVIVRRSPRISVGEWVPVKQEGAADAV